MLLEGLERHGEKWTEVADHVGTKTAEECVRRFARLPIEDAFVEDVDPATRARGAGRGAGNVGKTFDDEIVGEWGALGVPDPNAAAKDDIVTPFAGAPNPVMANVAFLATCVGPRVAAAAARAALAYLSAAAEETTTRRRATSTWTSTGRRGRRTRRNPTPRGWTWTAAKARD